MAGELTNLINLIDGIDGLAGGISLMLMLLIATVAHQNGNFELLACGMAGALVGFLCHNFPPARIYLGDGGAYFLGFQVGLYSVVNSHKGTVLAALVAPAFVLVFPVTDACLTLARRGLRGLPLFRPDRKHLHHRLLAAAGSNRRVVLILYGLSLLFLGMGLIAFWSRGEALPILLGAAVLVLFVCAGTCTFSRRWFAIHHVVCSSLRMRGHIQYALSLARWLELESRRRAGPDEFWPDLVFAADKLGFASLELTLQNEHRVWRRVDAGVNPARRQYECPQGLYGRLEMTAPACPLRRTGHLPDCDTQCRARTGNCPADPRLFETLSELLAEAWTRSAVHWNGHGVPLRFKNSMAQNEKANGSTQLMKTIVSTWVGMLFLLPLASAEPLQPGEPGLGLSRVPAAELPLAAAALLRQAKPQDRAALTTNVVAQAVALNPAAAPLIVGAIVRTVPETAPITVRIASIKEPRQVEDITRAAVAGVPDRAGEIVTAICEAAPEGYKNVALAAARLAPKACREILRGVAASRPDLKPFIEQEIAGYGNARPAVGFCLEQAELARDRANGAAQTAGTAKRGVGKGPPPVDKPPRGNGRPPGGRNYARP